MINLCLASVVPAPPPPVPLAQHSRRAPLPPDPKGWSPTVFAKVRLSDAWTPKGAFRVYRSRPLPAHVGSRPPARLHKFFLPRSLVNSRHTLVHLSYESMTCLNKRSPWFLVISLPLCLFRPRSESLPPHQQAAIPRPNPPPTTNPSRICALFAPIVYTSHGSAI